jgi:hypothetical protein
LQRSWRCCAASDGAGRALAIYLRIKARGQRELITVVGHAAVISAGEWVTASGEWVNDCTHGQQFKARFLKTSEPTSLDGIEKYLGSGMIRGIGVCRQSISDSWLGNLRGWLAHLV